MTSLIPAVDIIDGNVVRLVQGDYTKKHIYNDNPLETLQHYEQEGAELLHIVDLSGAKDPSKRQLDLITHLAKSLRAKIQVGGGVRNKDDVKALLDSGVSRVVIGSLALTNPSLCETLLAEFSSEAICIALDVMPHTHAHSYNHPSDNIKDIAYHIALHAWQHTSDISLFPTLTSYVKQGLRHLLCTDISRDGMMNGANIALYTHIKQHFPSLHLQASGGVSSIENLRALKGICKGVIVGKALLDGVFSVKEGRHILAYT